MIHIRKPGRRFDFRPFFRATTQAALEDRLLAVYKIRPVGMQEPDLFEFVDTVFSVDQLLGIPCSEIEPNAPRTP